MVEEKNSSFEQREKKLTFSLEISVYFFKYFYSFALNKCVICWCTVALALCGKLCLRSRLRAPRWSIMNVLKDAVPHPFFSWFSFTPVYLFIVFFCTVPLFSLRENGHRAIGRLSQLLCDGCWLMVADQQTREKEKDGTNLFFFTKCTYFFSH